MIKKAIIALWAPLFALAVLGSPVFAKNKADIVDVALGQEQGNMEVSFRIKNCFTPKMEEAIRNGVQTTFRIRVVLEKPGLPVFRSQVLDTTLEHSIKYDRLRNHFHVSMPETPERTRVTRSFEEAEHWMSTVSKLWLAPAWRLEKDQSYQIKIKAELSKVQLPLFLRYVFFFVSLWDFETDWQKITFTM